MEKKLPEGWKCKKLGEISIKLMVERHNLKNEAEIGKEICLGYPKLTDLLNKVISLYANCY